MNSCKRIIILFIFFGLSACGTRDSANASPSISPATAPSIPPNAKMRDESESVRHVIMVSVDGLAPRFIQPMIDQGKLPSFSRLQKGGSFTHEARADLFNTTTLPNHVTMLTGRPVGETPGFPKDIHHGFTLNVTPPLIGTLHNLGNREVDYLPSVFDVAHDFGRRTCFFAGKDKFIIFKRSYDKSHGQRDVIGEDNGRNKIDVSLINADTSSLVEDFFRTHEENPCHLTFLHLMDLDAAGHSFGWGSPAWLARLQGVDEILGRLIDLVEALSSSALIVTADHGGEGAGHGDPGKKSNFAVPFYVMGPGIAKGSDLYSLVSKTRFNPKDGNPSYADKRQPIRNGDMANLALELMGLPPIPGSIMFKMGLSAVR